MFLMTFEILVDQLFLRRLYDHPVQNCGPMLLMMLDIFVDAEKQVIHMVGSVSKVETSDDKLDI